MTHNDGKSGHNPTRSERLLAACRRLPSNPYAGFRKPARYVKVRFQMLIGAGLAFTLTVKLLAGLLGMAGFLEGYPAATAFYELAPLKLVSWGLMYAAGIELAYMLFTDGPDEAVHPVILALASTILLILSDGNDDWRDAAIVPLLTLSIGLLFYIGDMFKVSDRQPPEGTSGD
jgi:hypothetical protein